MKKREHKQVNFRIDLDLFNWLRENSQQNYRTMTAELNMNLRKIMLKSQNLTTKKADATRQSNSSANA